MRKGESRVDIPGIEEPVGDEEEELPHGWTVMSGELRTAANIWEGYKMRIDILARE